VGVVGRELRPWASPGVTRADHVAGNLRRENRPRQGGQHRDRSTDVRNDRGVHRDENERSRNVYAHLIGIDGGNCTAGGTVAAGGSCTLRVNYTPPASPASLATPG